MKNTILRTSFAALAACAAVVAAPARAAGADAFSDEVRQAFASAMADVSESVRGSAIPASASVSVLPLSGDKGDVVSGLVKIAVTDAGKTYVEGKSDPMWDEVVKEMAFDERNVGLLDAATLVKIGSLKATDVLVYGVVRASDVTENRVFVELELHATDVKTKTHLWGGLFAKRWYVPGADVPKGISELPLAVREQLKFDATSNLVASLKAQPKLSGIRSVVLIPLVGDEDRYCTYILRDAIVQTDLVPKELDLASLGGARAVFRDIPVVAGDAVVYGAVRQLGWLEERVTFPFTGWRLFSKVVVPTDFQAAIERNDTHDILWSDTIQSYVEFYDWNWIGIGCAAVAAVVLLCVAVVFLKAVTRVR